MEIILEKEKFLDGLKVVEKTTSQRGIQAILSNVIIKTTSNDRIVFGATDLNQTMIYKINAEVIEDGAIIVDPKLLSEIINKMPNKPITIKKEEGIEIIKILCDKTKFEINSIGTEGFPDIFKEKEQQDEKKYVLNKDVFNKAIKQTSFCCSQNESTGILNSVCLTIKDNIIEAAATDGNRLTRVRKPINSKGEEATIIISSKILNEIIRISPIVNDENITIRTKEKKLMFEFENMKYFTELTEGVYPKYQQLIPTTNEKKITIKKDELIEAIERVSPMVNERTNVMKFMFEENKLTLRADMANSGSGSDEIKIDYNYDDLIIGFNFKYVLDCLKNIETENVRIEMATNLSATIFRPDEDEDSHICLIMPIQVR